MVGTTINPPPVAIVDQAGRATPEFYRWLVQMDLSTGSSTDEGVFSVPPSAMPEDGTAAAFAGGSGVGAGSIALPVALDALEAAQFARPAVPVADDSFPNPFAGWLANTGRARAKVRAITASATINFADYVILADATGGAITVTLPTAGSARGFVFHVKKTDASANAVTLDGNGAETIDDSATQATSTQYVTMTVVSDGTEWWLI